MQLYIYPFIYYHRDVDRYAEIHAHMHVNALSYR